MPSCYSSMICSTWTYTRSPAVGARSPKRLLLTSSIAAPRRFASSRLGGRPAFALFEGRGELLSAGQPIALTDPAPEVLLEVCKAWGLELESS